MKGYKFEIHIVSNLNFVNCIYLQIKIKYRSLIRSKLYKKFKTNFFII